MIFALSNIFDAFGELHGSLVLGEAGQSNIIREARINELNSDIRQGATEWRQVQMCIAKQSVVRKQVRYTYIYIYIYIYREREREGFVELFIYNES